MLQHKTIQFFRISTVCLLATTRQPSLALTTTFAAFSSTVSNPASFSKGFLSTSTTSSSLSSSSNPNADINNNIMESKIRVVTYNVLSSHLASPDHFIKCDPQHLEASNRLPKILQKLEDQMDLQNKNQPTIFCLQEVSHSWAGKMHTFFANKNYHFITALYGKKFNNYMGIAIAIPLDAFQIKDVDICRLSDYRETGWPRLPETEPDGFITTTVKKLLKVTTAGLGLVTAPVKALLSIQPPKEPIDHWRLSENRFNEFIFCRLASKTNPEQKFCISNYHMPCAFYAPMVMNIHADLVVKRIQTLSEDDPYILAGDFNFMPDSPHYELVTKGTLSQEDSTYPTSKYGMVWESSIKPVRSAYAESENNEPDFTNYAQSNEDGPFIGTLDYIFLSKHWKVKDVLKTIDRNEANGPFPNAEEPSDHIMMWSDLEL